MQLKQVSSGKCEHQSDCDFKFLIAPIKPHSSPAYPHNQPPGPLMPYT